MKQKKTLLVGAGGQARVVASILKYASSIEVIGVIDSQKSSIGEEISGFKVIGTYNDLDKIVNNGLEYLALCMGDNQERENWFLRAEDMGLSVISAIHPTAFIEKDASVGKGVIICAGSIICTQAQIGDGVIVNTGASIDHETRLANFSSVAPGSRLAGRVSVGKRAFIGVGVTISNNIHVGEDAIIGAGSVVVKNIGKGVTAYGVPAIPKRVRK